MKNQIPFIRKAILCVMFASTVNIGLTLAKAPLSQNSVNYLKPALDLTPGDFVKQAMLLGMQQRQISGLAAEKSGSDRIKNFAKNNILEQAKWNEEIKQLARLRKIDLPMDKPQGGQRPDGRVDSAPENLQDTTRNQNQPEAQGTNKAANNGILITENEVSNTVSRLSKLTGNNFDASYLALMVGNQKQLISLFEDASNSKDKLIKRAAKKYLEQSKSNLSALLALQ